MTIGQFCSLCWISNKKFDYKIVTQNHNINLYHHLHHKNVTNQTNTLHFIPKNSGKNGIVHHYTIIHKCNTKIVTHSHNTNLDEIKPSGRTTADKIKPNTTPAHTTNTLQNHINITYYHIKHSHLIHTTNIQYIHYNIHHISHHT